MTKDRWRFSLRNLLVAFTGLALFVALLANDPGVAITFAILVFPFCFGAAVTHVSATPQFARLLMLSCGVVLIVASVFLFLFAEQNGGMNMDRFLALAVLWGYALICGFVARLIPTTAAR